jgi:chaperone required for assembly of F1-ATPase
MNDTQKKPASIVAGGRIGRAPPPKRFYEAATAGPHEAGFAVHLDGRVAKTPAGKPLAVARQEIAAALAAEWAGQGETLDPAAMPLTRLVNSALDGVADEMEAVRADIVRHAGSDLLCYRADGPEGLVARQEEMWAPLLAFAREALGARLKLAEGIMHVEQDEATLDAIARALSGYDALSLAALHTVTTLTGSAVIALAVAHGRASPEDAWAAAHVDEDWQMCQWGYDEEALARREKRWREMQAAGLVLGGTAQGKLVA